jgi:DNA-binding MarR family transcriptional regulator
MELERLAAQWRAERPDLDLSVFRLVASMLRLSDRLERAFRTLSEARFGLGTGDMRILLALRRSAPAAGMRPTELFQALLITSGAVTKQVDRLVGLGLVERLKEPGSPRGARIRLTPQGLAKANDAMEAISASFCGLERLDPAEARAIVAALDRMQSIMNHAAQEDER